jgi:hypothetical protein
MKFGNEYWLILFREYIDPKLFAVHCGVGTGKNRPMTEEGSISVRILRMTIDFTGAIKGHLCIMKYRNNKHVKNVTIDAVLESFI